MPATPLMRMIDASLNRAGEGLRVIEDFVRFVLDDPQLTNLAKSLRHDLTAAAASISAEDRHAARDTLRDVGTTISTDAEISRSGEWDVCAASLQRVAQSLRSLEEFGKLRDVELARQFKSLRYRVYTLEKSIDIASDSLERLGDAHLMVLVDGCESDEAFEHLVMDFVEAGVDAIQLRDKQLDDRQLLDRAYLLRRLTRGKSTLSIINDRPDIAALAHADGLHLGQDDLSIKDARSIVGTKMLVGVSTHQLAEAQAAVVDGANYLGAGPTFPSQTKDFPSFPGLGYLRELALETRLPVFAIGGVTPENVSQVMAAGITRVAVRSAVTKVHDPASATAKLLNVLKRATANADSPVLAPDS